MLTALTAGCVVFAATVFKVPEPALWTILLTEGGQVGACTEQANGTHDCGPAQINAETWVPHLARVLNRPEAEVFVAVRDNGCFNAWAASYVLSTRVKQAGGNAWEAAGLYNSATPAIKHAYQLRLATSYGRLFGH